ncbi:MAG: SGNH/GDSL hydrolase N-terminal domain-containing protein, partial [Pirellulaceae bacterium]
MFQLCPRWLHCFALSCCCLVTCADSQAQQEEPALAWHSAEELGIEGRGFTDTVKFFDRLPARAEEVVRPQVWNLSRHASGIQVLFKTDSPRIHVRYRLTEPRLAMPHMPATSVSGVDLYSKDDEGQWRWAAVLKPASQEIDAALIGNIAPLRSGSMREFRLYLPLYNGIEDLKIGIVDGTEIEPIEPSTQKPVVF